MRNRNESPLAGGGTVSRAPGVKPPSPGAQRLARWKAKGRPVSVTLQGADAIRAWDALTGGESGESQREIVEAALVALALSRGVLPVDA